MAAHNKRQTLTPWIRQLKARHIIEWRVNPRMPSALRSDQQGLRNLVTLDAVLFKRRLEDTVVLPEAHLMPAHVSVPISESVGLASLNELLVVETKSALQRGVSPDRLVSGMRLGAHLSCNYLRSIALVPAPGDYAQLLLRAIDNETLVAQKNVPSAPEGSLIIPDCSMALALLGMQLHTLHVPNEAEPAFNVIRTALSRWLTESSGVDALRNVSRAMKQSRTDSMLSEWVSKWATKFGEGVAAPLPHLGMRLVETYQDAFLKSWPDVLVPPKLPLRRRVPNTSAPEACWASVLVRRADREEVAVLHRGLDPRDSILERALSHPFVVEVDWLVESEEAFVSAMAEGGLGADFTLDGVMKGDEWRSAEALMCFAQFPSGVTMSATLHKRTRRGRVSGHLRGFDLLDPDGNTSVAETGMVASKATLLVCELPETVSDE